MKLKDYKDPFVCANCNNELTEYESLRDDIEQFPMLCFKCKPRSK